MKKGDHAKKRLSTKRKTYGIAGGVAALLAAGAVAFALVQGGVFGSSTQALDNTLNNALDNAQQICETDETVNYPIAESYSQESLEHFSDVLYVNNGTEEISLDDLPSGSYSGFLFEVEDEARGAGNAYAIAQSAEEEGIITCVHENLYKIDSLDTLAGLFGAEQLDYVEPNYVMHLVGEVDGEDDQPFTIQGGTSANPAPNYPPTDPSYIEGSLWNLDMLNVQGAWELGLDGDPYIHNSVAVRDTSVRVAVIDTGLYGTGTDEEKHEDINYDQVADGYNFATDDEGTPDAKGHGTFVSGLIAAKVNNGVGVAGAMPGVTIVPCKVFDTSNAKTSDVISAIYYAVDEAKVDVINMSLGGEYDDSSLETACEYATQQGVIVVASAGNDGVSTPNYPAAYDCVVGVASVDSTQTRSTWSQYGKSVFVTAPGEKVTSTYNEGATSYTTASGTSFSSPEVAALAAMCKSVYPDMTQDVFKQFLIDTSTDLGSAGYDDYYGYGLVDFTAMAQAVMSSQMLPWYNLNVTAYNNDGEVITGASVTITAAKDISWEDDPDENIEAGTWTAGSVITPEEDGSYKLHKGVYNYSVDAPGYYLTTGSFKTYTENQKLDVTMDTAYDVNVSVVNSAGAAFPDVHISITSAQGRVEQAESSQSSTSTSSLYKLRSGTYTYYAAVESGYVAAKGSFTIQRESKDIKLTLYAQNELSSVGFSFTDSDDSTEVTGASTVVYDAQGLVVSAQENGEFLLAKGLQYKAIHTRLGYEDAISEFTVDNADSMSIPVSLHQAECTITFCPATEDGEDVQDATMVVTDENGNVKSSSATNALRYNLKAGTYTYTISAPGYVDATGSFGVSVESRTLKVIMQARSISVGFNITSAATGETLSGASIKLTKASSSTPIKANEDGAYSLTPGEYRYSVYCTNYKSVRGSFTVAGDALVIPVALDAYSDAGEGYAGGSGTAEDPYLIATEEQLRYLANQTDIVRVSKTDAETNQKRTIDGYYQLVNDIELTSEWLPIGNYENGSNYVAFAGVFDGAGHTISGLNTTEADYDAQGLFGCVQAAHITNLTVEGNVVGNSYVGGIVGMVRFFYDSTYTDWNTGATRIENCCNRASVIGRYSVGGIVGNTQGSSSSNEDYGTLISACCNYGAVSAQVDGQYTKRSSSAGGIAGSAGNCKVEYCYNRADINAGYIAGGIVAQSLGHLALYNSYNAGNVYQYVSGTGYENTSGVIAGRIANSAVVSCYGLLSSDETAATTPVASIDSNTTLSNYEVLEHSAMWRSSGFLSLVNTDTINSVVTTNFVLGASYPILYWELDPSTPIVEEPFITVHPASPTSSYKQGENAAALNATANAMEEGTTLAWQWYECDENGQNAQALDGATGEGTQATYTPSTAEIGTRYYYVVYTHTVNQDGKTYDSSAASHTACVVVRSNIDAQTPTITKFNPSAAQDINTELSAKVTTDLSLSVEAQVNDGGTLSYQWYKASSMVGKGAAIAGATEASYDVDTSNIGTTYYYVEITNTYEAGNTASVQSQWVCVNINEYTIGSYEELISFRSAVNSGETFEGLIVTLLCDLDVSAANWEPIGTQEHQFKGTFMGGAGYSGSSEIVTHTISGINIDGDAFDNKYLGFFGVTKEATICDLIVEGKIEGENNRYAGLIVGQALSGYSASTTLENCATMASSYVEGKYCIGGLVGYGNVKVVDCVNHGNVYAYAFTPTSEDTSLDSYSYVTKAVGGVVGYSSSDYVQGCYNTGTIEVEALESGEKCAYYAGGIVGFSASSAAVCSCFGAGNIVVGTQATQSISYKPAGVVYAGSVVGYQVYDYLYNIHYLDGSCSVGTNSSAGYDYAENHTLAFMKTSYFIGLLHDQNSYGASFTQSVNGVPHLAWEKDTSEGSNLTDAAEAYIYDVTIEDIDDITSTWETYFYQGENAPNVYVWADQVQPDGGNLTYTWQKREVGGADDSWENYGSYTGECTQSDSHYYASMPIDTSSVGTYEYRCVITNTLTGATGAASIDNETPAITIAIYEDPGLFNLLDPTQANSSSNPWIIERADQLHFLAQLVNHEAKMVGMPSNSFDGQYISLISDLDLSAYEQWEPIGNGDSISGYTFEGCFDGNGHSITGLSIGTAETPASAADYKGLFGSISYGILRNLCVSGTVNMASGSWNTAGVCAYAYGSFIENVANHVDVTGSVRAGGIAGTYGSSKFLDCINTGTITVAETDSTSQYSVGGIAGHAFNSAQPEGAGIYNCANLGSVSCTLAYGTDPRFGSVLGERDSYTTVENCYYLAGSATNKATGEAGTGIGGANGSEEDVEGVIESFGSAAAAGDTGGSDEASGSGAAGGSTSNTVSATGSTVSTSATSTVDSKTQTEIAWLLNTSNAIQTNSARWGISKDGFDVSGSTASLGLTICGASPIYKVDTSAKAVQISVSSEYVTEGEEVAVSWRDKPGFTNTSVSWGAVGASEDSFTEIENGGKFTMPASDVSFSVTAEQDTRYRYNLLSSVVDAQGNTSTAATVAYDTVDADTQATAIEGETVTATITIDGEYQVASVSAQGMFGTEVTITRIDGLRYSVLVPADYVQLTVVVEPVGSPAQTHASSLTVNKENVHIYNSDDKYHTANLLYGTLALSGTLMEENEYLFNYKLQQESGVPALFTQYYSVDGTLHEATGIDVASLIRMWVEDPTQLQDSTPVYFETASGDIAQYTWGDIYSLAYSSFDETSQPYTRGLPVLLAFGQDGVPYTDNAIHLLFGQTSASDKNSERTLSDVTRIVVGEDANYAQHNYSTYADLDTVGGSDVVINIYQGEELTSSKTFTVKDIEALANVDRGGIYRGVYSALIYEDNEENYSGPYDDYYEGYSLYDVLLAAGLPQSAASDAPSSKVQFYQKGEWESAWKTVNVSLGYIAGNGEGGIGDYSKNFAQYGLEDGSTGVSIYGMQPTIAYGKNNLPLVYASGTTGVSVSAYNYRGPMVAMLPQNAAEGGYVESNTVAACYLGQIDVYLPAAEKPLFSVASESIAPTSNNYVVTYLGEVPEGSVVQVAGKAMYWDGEHFVCLLGESAAQALTNATFSVARGGRTELSIMDVNATGVVNVIDALAAYDLSNGVYADFDVVDEAGWLAADVDKDGRIDANDAFSILACVTD
jgi:hypothetical protein